MQSPKKRPSFETALDKIGNIAVEGFHYFALFIIGCMIAWSAVHTTIDIFTDKSYASIDDILLLFIYLELGAMVGIYFKTNRMPVRFLIYIAITALTRLLISVIQQEHQADWGLLIISGAILILAISIFIVRYASWHYPSNVVEKHEKPNRKLQPQDDELA